jgi:hypothetical protein
VTARAADGMPSLRPILRRCRSAARLLPLLSDLMVTPAQPHVLSLSHDMAQRQSAHPRQLANETSVRPASYGVTGVEGRGPSCRRVLRTPLFGSGVDWTPISVMRFLFVTSEFCHGERLYSLYDRTVILFRCDARHATAPRTEIGETGASERQRAECRLRRSASRTRRAPERPVRR